MPYFYIDWYYLVLVVPALLFSMWASVRVNSAFRKYGKARNARGMTGADAAGRCSAPTASMMCG